MMYGYCCRGQLAHMVWFLLFVRISNNQIQKTRVSTQDDLWPLKASELHKPSPLNVHLHPTERRGQYLFPDIKCKPLSKNSKGADPLTMSCNLKNASPGKTTINLKGLQRGRWCYYFSVHKTKHQYVLKPLNRSPCDETHWEGDWERCSRQRKQRLLSLYVQRLLWSLTKGLLAKQWFRVRDRFVSQSYYGDSFNRAPCFSAWSKSVFFGC